MQPASSDPFDTLPPALRALAERGKKTTHRKGTLLIEEGAFGDLLYIVLSGKVKAFSIDQREREITYGVYGAGEYLGEMSLDGGPRSASVITLERTECVTITRHTLREHIAANPEFAFELIARVIRRARVATLNMRNLALLDAYGRVVALLEGLAVPQPDGTRIVFERLTHKEIGDRVGCGRPMVSRLMKDLERGGHVTPEGETFRLAARLPEHW